MLAQHDGVVLHADIDTVMLSEVKTAPHFDRQDDSPQIIQPADDSFCFHSFAFLSTNFPMASIPQIISNIPKKSFSSTFFALHKALRLAPSGSILVKIGNIFSE